MENHIFISHSSSDAKQAEALCGYLEKRNKKCFIAPRDIRSGHEYAEELLDGIDNSYVVILMLSEKSNTSPHVLREIERAISKNIPVIVYKMENVTLSKSLEYFLMTHQWMDAKDSMDYERIYESVCGFSDGNTGSVNSVENDIKKRKKAPVIIGMVLGIIIVGLVVFFICRPKNNDAPSPNINNDVDYGIKTGDTFELGTYNDEKIAWSVLRINTDGTAVLVADKILTFKAYDASESGASYEYNGETYLPSAANAEDFELLVQTQGNNDWSTSNIRTWLNSDSKVVEYKDGIPVSKAMADRMNGYNTEPGFLYGFTDDEKNILTEVGNKTKEYYKTNGKEIVSKDKVYLLTKADIDDFEKAGISIYASPTDAAVKNNESSYYKEYKDMLHMDEYYWWLREPVEGTPYKCYFVTSGYEQDMFATRAVNVESFGIRPAITVDIAALYKYTEEK